jgi:hypothetical protein
VEDLAMASASTNDRVTLEARDSEGITVYIVNYYERGERKIRCFLYEDDANKFEKGEAIKLSKGRRRYR